jgi:hypothetical protein
VQVSQWKKETAERLLEVFARKGARMPRLPRSGRRNCSKVLSGHFQYYVSVQLRRGDAGAGIG